MLSEYYNQNPIKRFFKNRETQQREGEAAILRTTIAQARLLDDAEIARRLGTMAKKEPIPKYGNLKKTEKDDAGKSKEQVRHKRARDCSSSFAPPHTPSPRGAQNTQGHHH